jgi:hypothetical protein
MEAAYGANVPCDVQCAAASQAPEIVTTQSDPSVSGDITGTATADCIILVQGTTQAVGLAINVAFNATVGLSNWEVFASINFAEVVGITTYENALNQAIDVEGLTFMINAGLALAVPYVDQTVLASGISLPHINNVNLSDGSVTVGNGYIYVEATPVYQLAEEVRLSAPETKDYKLLYE